MRRRRYPAAAAILACSMGLAGCTAPATGDSGLEQADPSPAPLAFSSPEEPWHDRPGDEAAAPTWFVVAPEAARPSVDVYDLSGGLVGTTGMAPRVDEHGALGTVGVAVAGDLVVVPVCCEPAATQLFAFELGATEPLWGYTGQAVDAAGGAIVFGSDPNSSPATVRLLPDGLDGRDGPATEFDVGVGEVVDLLLLPDEIVVLLRNPDGSAVVRSYAAAPPHHRISATLLEVPDCGGLVALRGEAWVLAEAPGGCRRLVAVDDQGASALALPERVRACSSDDSGTRIICLAAAGDRALLLDDAAHLVAEVPLAGFYFAIDW
jgi:hypothetical protein